MIVLNDFIGIVPARAGSKSFINKNLADLSGQSLVSRAVHQSIRVLKDTILTTDIHERYLDNLPAICQVDPRPSNLALDETPMSHVLRYLIKKYSLEHKYIVLLQPTSPLRTDESIISAIDLYVKNDFSMVMSVSEKSNVILKYGTAVETRFMPLSSPEYCFSNRQILPKVYGPNGAIYIFSAKNFIECDDFPTKKIGFIELSKENAIDIDTPNDLESVRKILKNI